MNNYKKIISTTLAALMVAGSASVTFARDYNDVGEKHDARVEISVLSDIGVIKGTSEENFSPDAPVSREQMAAVLFRLMLGRDDAGRVNTTKFTDLYEPYYNGAISWANSAGYILGTTETRFNPKGGITKQDAMAMLIRALGQDNGRMNEGYPWSYINAAVKLGLDRGLEKVAYTDTLTRAEAAVIVYNALTAEYLIGKQTSNGNIYYESTSVIEEVFGYKMAEAAIIATNDYSMEGDTVLKNGYVTLAAVSDGRSFTMTVPADSMKLSGTANQNIGRVFDIIFSENDGKHEILSAVEANVTEYSEITVNAEKNTVKIGDNTYTLVKEYSDSLSRNHNELKLFAFGDGNQLRLVEDVEALSPMLGFYRVTMMSDGDQPHAIIRMFEMAELKIDEQGRINIADQAKAEDIHLRNEKGAQPGDYVLFYYNKLTGELEIAEVLEEKSGVVNRLTADSVKLGDDTLKLGNATAGISAESIKNALTVGKDATVVIHNGRVVAVRKTSETQSAEGNYLIALSDPMKVYEGGAFKYVMTAFVDGKEQNIYVKDSSANAGEVYRFTKQDDKYTLIPAAVEDGIILSGKGQFIENTGEMAFIIGSAESTTLEMNGKTHFTLTPGTAEMISSVAGLEQVKFITDKNTKIILGKDGKISEIDALTASVTIAEGAKVVAILQNEIGSVETAKFIFISEGEVQNVTADRGAVRVLENHGLVFVGGSTKSEYLVFNFTTGKVETMLSDSAELQIGRDYKITDAGITAEEKTVVEAGFVTGYTAGTVTVGGTTMAVDADTKIVEIKDGKLQTLTVAQIYMSRVEFIAEEGRVALIIKGEGAGFEAEADAVKGEIILIADFDLTPFKDTAATVLSLKRDGRAVTLGTTTAEFNGNTVVVKTDSSIELSEGEYTLEIRVGTKSHTVKFAV